jgi:hypothetical protein
MGYGTIIMSSFGNREEKIAIINKIWARFGRGGFVSSTLSEILTKDEMNVTNMNRWKHANLVTHDGWGKVKGKPYRKWKLTSQTIEQCVKNVE